LIEEAEIICRRKWIEGWVGNREVAHIYSIGLFNCFAGASGG